MTEVITHTVSAPAISLGDTEANNLAVRFPKTGFLGACLMLFKAMVGAGLFALPYAFKLMGFGGGIVAMGIIGGLTWYTNMLIVRVHDVVTRDTFKKDLTYVSLVQHCFGRWGASIVYGLIVFTTIGSLTAYLLFMAQVMNSMLPVLSIIQWAGVLAVIVLPLCLVRNSAFLAYTSMMGNIGVALVVTAVLVRGAQISTIHSIPDYTDFRSSTFMQAFGIVGFLYACSTNVLTISKAMAKKEQFGAAMSWTIVFTFFSCASFALVNYLYFGNNTCSIIVLNAGTGPLALTAKIAIVIDLAFTYPLAAAPAREIIERSIFTNATPHLFLKQVLVRTILGAITFAVCFFPQFSIIVNIVGGWSVSVLAFILPCMMLLQLRRFHLSAFHEQQQFIKSHNLDHKAFKRDITDLASPQHTSAYLSSGGETNLHGHKVVEVAFEGEPEPMPQSHGVDIGHITVHKLQQHHHQVAAVHAVPSSADHANMSAGLGAPAGNDTKCSDGRVDVGRLRVDTGHAQDLYVKSHAQLLDAQEVNHAAHGRRASALDFFAHMLSPHIPLHFDPWTAMVAEHDSTKHQTVEPVKRSQSVISAPAGDPADDKLSATHSAIVDQALAHIAATPKHLPSWFPIVSRPAAQHASSRLHPSTSSGASPSDGTSPANVHIRLHGHTLHRPRGNTSLDVLSVPSHPTSAHAPSAALDAIAGIQESPLTDTPNLPTTTPSTILRASDLAHAPTPSPAPIKGVSKQLARAAKSKGRHVEALQLLGIGTRLETVFLVLVTLFGVAVLILTTVQSIQEAVSAAEPQPAVCSGG